MSCSSCKKVCDEFAIKKNGKPYKICNVCVVNKRAYYKKHKEEIKLKNKEYRDTHKEEKITHRETLMQNPLCCSRCLKIGVFDIKKNGEPYKLCKVCIFKKRTYCQSVK